MTINKFFTAGIFGDCLAFLVGAVMTFAFAPFHIYPLAIISPAVLLGLWLTVSKRRAFFRGWLYGLGMFGFGVYWVFISIHTYGDASNALSAFITGGLIAILALYPGISGYLLNRYFPEIGNPKLLYAFPAIWVFFEWVRSWLLTGFPWLTLGYTQINSPLRGYASLLSVYGVSLVLLICSALLVKAVLNARQQDYKNSGFNLLAILVIFGVGTILSHIVWTKPFGAPIKVSLVQGNIPQSVKWSPESLQPTLDTYTNLTKDHWDSKIIVWPESAIPIPMHMAEDFLLNLNAIGKKHGTTFITGIPVKLPSGDSYYNAIVTFGNGGGFYLKHRLVPFGEYVPFRKFVHGLLDILNIPMSDFVPATARATPLQAGNLQIGAYICYEIAYPEIVLTDNAQLNMLLTVSNDAWFGKSIAQAQHLEMAQMRAVEMGRPVLFVSNNGITAIIKANGKIQSTAPPYETVVLTDDVQPTYGKTPWQKFGIDPLLFILLILILIAVRERRMQKASSAPVVHSSK
ncbi:MAG: apolipoprotein N-acyltransferase [Gammaproteobacteria bacterium]